jgi:hypothetical protein
MGTIHHHHASGQRAAIALQSRSHHVAERPLTRSERARIALASLAIFERKCRLRLAQIQAERRAILAEWGWAVP